MGKYNCWLLPGRWRRFLSLVLVFSIVNIPQANSAAQGASQGLNMMQMLAAAMQSAAAGTSSIASGNQNVAQGHSMQNEAQMMMGLMQIAMGILGMLAAAAAGAKGDKSGNNQDKMNGLNDYNPNSYKSTIQPESTAGTTSGASGDPSTSNLGVTPSDLRTGDLGNSMAIMEKNFGINRDEFLTALKGGKDPRDILAAAPKHTPSMDTLNKIAAGLAANPSPSVEDAARSIASMGGSGGTTVNQAGGIAPGPLAADEAAATKAAGAKLVVPSTAPEEDEDAINRMSVSPEVKAALLQKAAQLRAERELQESNSWSIFQLVHSRYRKIEPMLYGRVEHTNIPSPSEATRGF